MLHEPKCRGWTGMCLFYPLMRKIKDNVPNCVGCLDTCRYKHCKTYLGNTKTCREKHHLSLIPAANTTEYFIFPLQDSNTGCYLLQVYLDDHIIYAILYVHAPWSHSSVSTNGWRWFQINEIHVIHVFVHFLEPNYAWRFNLNSTKWSEYGSSWKHQYLSVLCYFAAVLITQRNLKRTIRVQITWQDHSSRKLAAHIAFTSVTRSMNGCCSLFPTKFQFPCSENFIITIFIS